MKRVASLFILAACLAMSCMKHEEARINTLAFVSNEYKVSRAVEGLGIQVPKMYEIVKVGDAYATLSQRIRNKKSFSRTCQENPDRSLS